MGTTPEANTEETVWRIVSCVSSYDLGLAQTLAVFDNVIVWTASDRKTQYVASVVHRNLTCKAL